MRRPLALLCALPCVLALAACGSTVSSSSFKGVQHEVATTISNFQADATAGEAKKLCSTDLAAGVVARLGGTKRCETAITKQLAEVDSLEISIQSIQLSGSKDATAHVVSVYGGKKAPSTLALVKEGGKWRVSGL
jgi:hypothetical protein